MDNVILWIACGMIGALTAVKDGRSGFGWLCLSIILGPIVWILFLALPSKELKAIDTVTDGELFKKCPVCAERILAEARKCRYCGEHLSSPAGSERPIYESSPFTLEEGSSSEDNTLRPDSLATTDVEIERSHASVGAGKPESSRIDAPINHESKSSPAEGR